MIHTILDLIGVAGILMLAYGLYILAPVYMFTIIGGLFICFSILAEMGTVTIRLRKKVN